MPNMYKRNRKKNQYNRRKRRRISCLLARAGSVRHNENLYLFVFERSMGERKKPATHGCVCAWMLSEHNQINGHHYAARCGQSSCIPPRRHFARLTHPTILCSVCLHLFDNFVVLVFHLFVFQFAAIFEPEAERIHANRAHSTFVFIYHGDCARFAPHHQVNLLPS